MTSIAILLALLTAQTEPARHIHLGPAMDSQPAQSSSHSPSASQSFSQERALSGATSAITTGRDFFARKAAGDARLNSVIFVDAQFGWTVGDRGVIWHTDDGGDHWTQQASPTFASLASVSFVDRNNGWAAGGILHPYRAAGQAVVLATHDGGRNWIALPGILLPPIRQIHFDNDRQGWAVGDVSPMYPGGAFLTRDAGRTWIPAGVGGRESLLTGGFYSSRAAVVAGRNAAAMTILEGDINRVNIPGLALQNLHALRLVPPDYGWLVGDGGFVALTPDRGRSWRAPLSPPDAATMSIDYNAIAVRGPRAWLVGNPGGRVVATPDAGRAWTTPSTGSSIPLHSVCFVDDEHGWAVGDLGEILATSDGGTKWRVQRAGGDRAAMLVFAVDGEEIPLELIAQTCGGLGQLGVVEVIGRRDVDLPRREVDLETRAHQAVVAAGGSAAETAWQFPMRQPGLNLPGKRIVDSWDRIHSQKGAGDLLAYCVGRIRVWRPTIIVIYASASGESESQKLLRETVVRAIAAAADENQFTELSRISAAGAWRVQRLFAVSDSKVESESGISATDRVPHVARSLAEIARPARALLQTDFQPGPNYLNVDMLTEAFSAPRDENRMKHSADQENKKGDLENSIALSAGGARRATDDSNAANANLQSPDQRSRRWQALIEHLEKNPQATLHAIATTDELEHDFDPADAADMLYRLGDHLRRTGRWDMAAACFGRLATRFPDDPLARSAIAMQIQIEATASRPSGEFVPAAMLGPQRAIDLGTKLEAEHPDLFASPDIRYPLAAAYRRIGQSQKLDRLYTPDSSRPATDGWATCARGESWIIHRKGVPPKRMATCANTSERPKLDGKLDDAIWQKAKPCALASPLGDDEAWPTSVMFAHDSQYLYVAVQCRMAPGASYEATPSGPRPRDPDLSGQDRVELFLDIDRTYATYYRLTIDHRGWVADSFWGDPTWNPKWFVAAHQEGRAWTAEAAIPLAELSVKSIGDDMIWSLGIQRVVPGVGFQSWTTPAATTVAPQGFGWLSFEK